MKQSWVSFQIIIFLVVAIGFTGCVTVREDVAVADQDEELDPLLVFGGFS